MTEPNKELPKEVQEWLRHHFSFTASGYDANLAAERTHNHYAPIIEDKDKEIAEQKAFIAQIDEVLTEKDVTISKLMGLLRKQLIQKFYKIHRAKGNFAREATYFAKYDFVNYCKENGIDLGGE